MLVSKKGSGPALPWRKHPWSFRPGLAASQSGAALPLAEPQHHNGLSFANFRDGQPQKDPAQKPQPPPMVQHSRGMEENGAGLGG